MRLPKKDLEMLAEAYDQVHGGGYGSTLGSATPEDINKMNNFIHNVLGNYAYSKEIPEEYRTALQSWVSAKVTEENYDKAASLIRNISSELPDTDIANMINQFTNSKSSRGTTTPFSRG
jgi:hypothetical protein